MGHIFDRLVSEVKALQQSSAQFHIEDSFTSIANFLMNDVVLRAGINNYRLVEIEFYYFSDQHQDPYVHKHEAQKTLGRWYIHGAGLDITFGTMDFYGGILIRGVQRRGDKQFISGPLNVASEVIHHLGGVEDQEIHFGLKEYDLPQEQIASSRRVGLNPRKNDGELYVNRPYRYISCISSKHPFKQKKQVALDLNGNMPKEEVNKIFGYKIV
ncbi:MULTISPECIES: hypothetical protein [Flammeovirga]|uniref:Uncharacterized protein n=1 Tax=Flammeovirga agarivorans TaxID=2726742 RepID=A0A7X8XUP6_9BACT|nr:MULTISPECIES: hypothetical protein [Flammeovirga]NLR90454.1 hypothetical protein [Flammeovirga agarivorans]